MQLYQSQKQYSNKLFLVASELGKRQHWNGNGGEQKEHDEQEMEEMIRHSWYRVCAIKFSQQYSKRFHIAAISCHLRCSKHTNVTNIHSVLNTHTHSHLIPTRNVVYASIRSKQSVTLLHTNSKLIFPKRRERSKIDFQYASFSN